MRDLTRPCQAGYSLPLDRCPSDSDSRAAFAIGRRCRLLGYVGVERLEARTDPLMGDLFRVVVPIGAPFTLQAWPHPQNPQQLLLVEVPGELWDAAGG